MNKNEIIKENVDIATLKYKMLNELRKAREHNRNAEMLEKILEVFKNEQKNN